MHTYTYTYIHTYGHTQTDTDRHIDTQTDRHIDRQTHRHRETQSLRTHRAALPPPPPSALGVRIHSSRRAFSFLSLVTRSCLRIISFSVL
jgi:hypothetical protein